jgi:hypothetical protein
VNGSPQDDEAREFLQGFLDQLAASDRTNRELVRVQLGLFQQNNQIIQALSAVSAQLDGVAQRTDYLYDQMGRLAQILVNDPQSLPVDPYYTPPHDPQPSLESYAQNLAGKAVNGFVSSFFPGRGSSGRARRR